MKDLTKGNIYKTFILFAIPLVLAGFLSQAYNIINTIIAGKLLNTAGIAAIGATSPFIKFVSMIFYGYSMGVSVYTARLFGAKDFKKLKQVIFNNEMFLVVTIVFVSVVTVVLRRPVFAFLKIDKSIYKEATEYFIIYMLGLVSIVLNYFYLQIIISLGDSSFSLVSSIIATALNIGFAYFNVKVLKIGVGGIALATVVSSLIINALYLIKIRKAYKLLGVAKQNCRMNVNPIKSTFRYSGPVMIQQSVMYFSPFVVSPVANSFGGAASAAYIICQRIYDINSNLYQNSAKTVTNYIAQSVGAGKEENIKRGLRVGALQSLVFLMPALILTIVFKKEFCLLFMSSDYDKTTLSLALLFIARYIPLLVFNVINNLFHAFYRGVAALKFLVASTVISSVSQIVFTYVFKGSLGFEGVYIGWAASWVIGCLYSLIVYFSGAWNKKKMY